MDGMIALYIRWWFTLELTLFIEDNIEGRDICWLCSSVGECSRQRREVLVYTCFAPVDRVQLITHEAQNRNLEGLCLTFPWVDHWGIPESYLTKDDSAVSHFPEFKFLEEFLNTSLFLESHALCKFHIDHGLKKNTFLIFMFWESEIQKGNYVAELEGLCAFWHVPGKTLLFEFSSQ